MKKKHEKWLGIGLGLAASLAGLVFVVVVLMGFGPNLGLPVGYHGRLNRILSRIETNPTLEITEVRLHRDTTLEDFYIVVRTDEAKEVELTFEGAAERPFDELLRELAKVGM
jgi:hypothetical protein